MNTLTFDVEAEKAQLTTILSDRIGTQGAIYNVLNVDLKEVLLDNVIKKIPHQDEILKELKQDLKLAQSNAENWLNEVQPHLTVIPQASINFASKWKASIQLILDQIRKPIPDKTILIELFGGFLTEINQQLKLLQNLMALLTKGKEKLAIDASNFSTKHEGFKQLEGIDKKNILIVKNKVAQIKASIAELNNEIDVEAIKADKDLAIASTAMKYGNKLGKAGKVVGLTIGLVFIISASQTIDNLIQAVDARFEDEKQIGNYETELDSLTAQLLALEIASSGLSSFVNQLEDLITSFQKTIDNWNRETKVMDSIIAELKGATPVDQIINAFDLGRTQQQWDEIQIFANKWQRIEITPVLANDLLLKEATLEVTL